MALNTSCMEAIFVEVEIEIFCTDKNVIVGVIYRPPNTDAVLFNDVILQTLNTIHQEHKLCHLMGDYNLNLLNATFHEPTSDFLNQMYTFSLEKFYLAITPTAFTLMHTILLNAYNIAFPKKRIKIGIGCLGLPLH